MPPLPSPPPFFFILFIYIFPRGPETTYRNNNSDIHPNTQRILQDRLTTVCTVSKSFSVPWTKKRI